MMQTSYYSLIDRIERYVSSPSEDSSSDSDASDWNSDDSWESSQSTKLTAKAGCFEDVTGHPVPVPGSVSFSDNYEKTILEMEEVAIKYVVEPDVPVLSTMMRDLNHHHISKILKTYRSIFPSIQERALVLAVVFDLVSCCSQQGPLSTSYELCKSPIRMKEHLAKLKEGIQDIVYSQDEIKLNHSQLQSMKKLLGASVSRLPSGMSNGFYFILNLLGSKINILEKEEVTRRYFPMYDFKTEEDFEETPVKIKAKKRNKTPTKVNQMKQPPVNKKIFTYPQADVLGSPDYGRALFSNISTSGICQQQSPDEAASDMFSKWQSKKMSLANSCGSNTPEVHQSKALNKRENGFPLKYMSSNHGACTSSEDEDFIKESLHDDIYLPNAKVTSYKQAPDSSRNVLTSSENTELSQSSTKKLKLTKESEMTPHCLPSRNGEAKPHKYDSIVSYSDSEEDLSFYTPEATEAKWKTTSSSIAVENCKSFKTPSIHKKKLDSLSCASSTKHHSSSPHSPTAIEERYLTGSKISEKDKGRNLWPGDARKPEKITTISGQSSLKTGAPSGKMRTGTLLDWLKRRSN